MAVLDEVPDLTNELAEVPTEARRDWLAARDLSGADLSSANLAGLDLRGLDFTNARLDGASLFRSQLDGCLLRGASLVGAELSGASLRGADLEASNFERAGLGMADLRMAKAFSVRMAAAVLSGANLEGADFKKADLQGANLREAGLAKCDLAGSDLREADLGEARLGGASFREADLRGATLRGIVQFEDCDWIGADVRDVNFNDAHRARREIIDQNYLDEYRRANQLNRYVYWIWWATSDCGRSMFRWCLWIGISALIFAGLYSTVEVDWGDYPSRLSPLYYSVVTLTTLGYGDVTPASTAAQVISMLEVAIGYLMLGGLLSILSNKMARRAE